MTNPNHWLLIFRNLIRIWHEIGADRTSDRALAEGRPPERGRSEKRCEANRISFYEIAAMRLIANLKVEHEYCCFCYKNPKNMRGECDSAANAIFERELDV